MMEEKRISPDHSKKTVLTAAAMAESSPKAENRSQSAARKAVVSAMKKPALSKVKKPSAAASKKETSASSKKKITPDAKKPAPARVKKTEQEIPAAPISQEIPEVLFAGTEGAESDLNPILESGAMEISVPLSAESIRAFSEYARLLKEWNEKMNLTNITDDKGIAIRHFIDSLTLVSHLEDELVRKKKKSLSLIDVGTGAGFPGIPLKVALPWLEVTLLDSLRKRVGFLDAVCLALELTGINTVHSRAEDAGLSKQYREKYDVATARAVASLPVLCEYCLPFVKIGGIFLAMKGHVEEEAEISKKAIVSLGGTLETLHHFTLPGTDMKRSIIVIRKVRATPAKYPRQAGKPEKEPIL